MVILAITALLYVCGFVFLYGVVRLAVRHGIQDVEVLRQRAAETRERDQLRERLRDRTLVPDNAYLAGG